MAADGYGSKGQPEFDDGGAPDTAVDPTLAAEYASVIGNRIVGTSTERAAFSTIWAGFSDGPWDGLEFEETDTGILYKRISGAWKAWESNWISYTATLSNLAVGTGGSAAAVTRYRWVWGELEVSMRFVLGSSGASVGTNPAASLPVTVASPAHAGALYAPFSMYDASGSASRFGFAVADSTANYVRFYQMTAAFAQAFDSITASSPWTWAAGDVIAARFMVSPA